jgi:hypothetical protein
MRLAESFRAQNNSVPKSEVLKTRGQDGVKPRYRNILTLHSSFRLTVYQRDHCRILTMTSQLPCNASGAELKQPLVVVQDLESSSSSSSQEEQNNDNARRGASNLILVKNLCFGLFVSLLVQAVTHCACLVLTKHQGKNPKPDESACSLSPWGLQLIIHMNFAFFALVWGIVAMLATRKGSMYLRKKFDNDADAPNSESISTPRFLFHSVTGFLFGVNVGSDVGWAIAEVELGMPFPLAPLLSAVLLDAGLCCLMMKCFDWSHQPGPFSTGSCHEDEWL